MWFFLEIYSTQDPNTKEFLYEQFTDFLSITHMRDANKNLTYKVDGVNILLKWQDLPLQIII